jgi:hypothetical protein
MGSAGEGEGRGRRRGRERGRGRVEKILEWEDNTTPAVRGPT